MGGSKRRDTRIDFKCNVLDNGRYDYRYFHDGDVFMTTSAPQPPDYILARPREKDVPFVVASCDKENIDDLKELRQKGEYIYKLMGRKP
jgi:hypothetical protein